MPDMHAAMDDHRQTPEHYYVGCTRAKESLYLTFTGKSLPDYFEEFSEDSYEFRAADAGTQAKRAEQNIIEDDLPF